MPVPTFRAPQNSQLLELVTFSSTILKAESVLRREGENMSLWFGNEKQLQLSPRKRIVLLSYLNVESDYFQIILI